MNNLTTLSSAHERFLNHLKNESRSVHTILAYGNDTKQLIAFLEEKKIIQVSSVQKEHIKAFKKNLQKRGFNSKTISRKLNAIKTFFRFLKKEGVVKEDPSSDISHPKYEIKPPRILTKLEYRALRDTCRQDPRLSAIVELMLQTGIRIGEVERLELNDIGKNHIEIKPYGSQSKRKIPLNQAGKQALERYLSQRPKTRVKNVFVTKTGKPLLVRNIRSSINRYLKMTGIKNATPNDLRNTWIAYHLRSGTDVSFLSKMAGHKRLSSTQKYLEALKKQDKIEEENPNELKEL